MPRFRLIKNSRDLARSRAAAGPAPRKMRVARDVRNDRDGEIMALAPSDERPADCPVLEGRVPTALAVLPTDRPVLCSKHTDHSTHSESERVGRFFPALYPKDLSGRCAQDRQVRGAHRT